MENVTELNIEGKEEILVERIETFLIENGINYQSHLNLIWPAVEYLTILNERYSSEDTFVYDFIGQGKNLNIYCDGCDAYRNALKKGENPSKYRFYNMTGEQLRKSFDFFESLLRKHGLSIYQEFRSRNDYYKIQNEVVKREGPIKEGFRRR